MRLYKSAAGPASPLRIERTRLSLAQWRLAALAGISQSHLSRIERGTVKATDDEAARIREALERERSQLNHRTCSRAVTDRDELIDIASLPDSERAKLRSLSRREVTSLCTMTRWKC